MSSFTFIVRNPNAFDVDIPDLGLTVDANEPGIDLATLGLLIEEILESSDIASLLAASTLIRVVGGSDVPASEALNTAQNLDPNIVDALNDSASPSAANVFATIADIIGGGLTATTHRDLDQLIHAIAEDNYEEFIYSGFKVTDIVVWEDNTKVKKIREQNFTYTGFKVNIEVIKQYNAAGVLVETLTGTYAYSGFKIQNIDWVLT